MTIKLEKKKDSNNYPLVAFRVTQQEKDEIMKGLEQTIELINKNKSNNEKSVRKNKIFVEAMRRGMKNILDDYEKIAVPSELYGQGVIINEN